MNTTQKHPFLFFFIDDLLPDCFGQKKGMTFRSLLTDEPITDKITYDGIKRSFQNLHAEFDAFEDFYKKLKTITNRTDFFRQQIIGKNKKTHTRGNNLFELEFSPDGRMDVSIIQNDGIKCVLILDVRISNHYDKSDNVIHAKNDALAGRILSALDEREIYKTKSMVESDAAFKNGLITYQNELLQSINTTEAKFEILLNTLDAIIFSNKSIEAKKSLFFDKLFDITQELSISEQQKFDDFVEQHLTADTIKQYHKELLQKLWYFNPDENTTKDLSVRFDKIKVAKTFAKLFLNQVADISDADTLTSKNITDMYRIFNKIPTSYLYVLQDELNDIDIGNQNDELPADMATLASQKQLELFLEHLIHLKTQSMHNIYHRFKKICTDYHKGKMEPQTLVPASVHSTKSINDVLYISMKRLADKENIDTLSYGLMYMIIHKNPSMRRLIDAPQNEGLLNAPDTFGYHWLNSEETNNSLSATVNKFILAPNKDIENKICEYYPFLAPYILQLHQNKGIPDSKLNILYNALKTYTEEKEFDRIYEALKTFSENEKALLRSFYSSQYIQTPEDIDIAGYILGTFELIELENTQKHKKTKAVLKDISQNQKDEEKSANKQIRQRFIETFNEFFTNVDNDEKKQRLKHSLESLNETVLNGLKTLPKNDILGIFIRNFLQEKDNPSAFDTALNPVILNARETKKVQLFDEINTFFTNHKNITNTQKLKHLCTSLSKNDISYLMDICHQHPACYAKEQLFLEAYQQYTSNNFNTLLSHLKNEYALLLTHAQEKRIVIFETALNTALFSSDKKADEHLLKACQALTKEDIKVCLTEKKMNIPATILLQKITSVIEQNVHNQEEKIKTHIETVKRLTDFQNTFALFANNFNSKKHKGVLIKKYLQLSTQDLDIFVNLNKQDPFYTTFFEKLLKNKRKNPELSPQQKGAVAIVDATIKKLKFYNAISAFFNQTQKNADTILVEQFLTLTENGYTELSEILTENKNNSMATFFLKQMKETHRDTPPAERKKALSDLINETNWLVDFYQSMKQIMLTKESTDTIFQEDPSQENADSQQAIHSIMKLQIDALSLSQVSVILYAQIFDKQPLVHNEVLKSGFCKTVMNFKNNPGQKRACTLVLAFCDELQDRHYDEIVQEEGENSFITGFIKDLRKYSNSDSLNKIRKKMGNKEYLGHVMDFLLKKSKDLFHQDIEKYKNKLRDYKQHPFN